jgi:hypothetical protein
MSFLASASVGRHYLRGAIGLLALIAAALGVAFVSPLAVLLVFVSLIAWRGCPTCWAIGLGQTRACRRPGTLDG